MIVNNDGFVCCSNRKKNKVAYKDWWIVKASNSSNNHGVLSVNVINFPKRYIGKRIKLKVVVLNEKEKP